MFLRKIGDGTLDSMSYINHLFATLVGTVGCGGGSTCGIKLQSKLSGSYWKGKKG